MILILAEKPSVGQAILSEPRIPRIYLRGVSQRG